MTKLFYYTHAGKPSKDMEKMHTGIYQVFCSFENESDNFTPQNIKLIKVPHVLDKTFSNSNEQCISLSSENILNQLYMEFDQKNNPDINSSKL